MPAAVFHLDDRGRIAPGLRADLLLVDGDPKADIQQTRAIVKVWKLGVAESRDYRAEVAGAKARLAGRRLRRRAAAGDVRLRLAGARCE